MRGHPTPVTPGRPARLCRLLAAACCLPALHAAASPLAAGELEQASSTASPPAPVTLRLAQQLTPGTLASDGGQRRLLQALYTLLDEYPDVRKARAALESAGHDVHTARGARWPTFKVGTNTGDAQLRRGRESYTAVNAEVRMALLDGGAIGAGIRSAESQEAAQGSVLYGTRQNVLLEALTSLLELQRFESKARIAAESARIIGQLARIEERRAELGAVGRNDLRQAASRQAGALAQQHALESQRMDALARFTRYFGFTPEAGWLPRLHVPDQWLPTSEDTALQASEAVSPELQEMEQQIEKARAEVDRSKSQRFPTLAAVVAHTRDPSGVLYAEGTRYGVELSWNFGNGFELRDKILKAINELQAQEAQQETVRRQVRETASAAWGRTLSGRQRETQLADAVREARAAFEGRRRLLEVGRGSLAQVLDAQLDMQRLMLDEADAVHDQRINELRLVRTTGRLLPQDPPEQWLNALFTSQKPLPSGGEALPATPDPAPGTKPDIAPQPPRHEYPDAAVAALSASALPQRLQLRIDPQLRPVSNAFSATASRQQW
ncbi:Outer membrane efflux protein BepC precursor [Delftia tsuruhatensis]|uniref:TolC family protein n=1 Tax=Delftia tsuruhatensis TaxID=180282 RepID=UPI001E7B2D49|nr:TolC family protein [Delftia tsuruhatensis]CAB5684999.1 Outer membrane efflux protein BepC precursor [Delftia tsuruhatensis]CAC9690048.1 Outer membrane efflux protein BepC precursor [Delftia tsuruhatensis]